MSVWEAYFQGQVSEFALRDLRLRLDRGLAISNETVVYLVEIVEEVLETAGDLAEDPALKLEELNEALKEIVETANKEANEAEEKAEAAEKKLKATYDDHKRDTAAIAATADELRKRAEKAEHEAKECRASLEISASRIEAWEDAAA